MSIHTGGGLHVGGDASAGRDLVGRDRLSSGSARRRKRGGRKAQADLRNRLAYLYDTPGKARMIAADVGLDTSTIDFSGSMQEIWQSILSEARKTDRIDEIVRLADSYGE